SPAPGRRDDVVVGRITGAWGVRGDLRVDVLSDSPTRFSTGSTLRLGGRVATVERSHRARGGLVVKFDIVSDRSEAESMRGQVLTVPQDRVAPLPGGRYYHFQIIDMDVWDEAGDKLGRVKEIIETGVNDVYVIDRPDQRDLLIPALAGVVLEVSVGDNRMIVKVPEGLE
ncbi:MAG: ribosome maturation factor RimM, partial [Dehalococcoidia bacterium]